MFGLIRFIGIYYGLLEFITVYWNLLRFIGIYYGLLEFITVYWNLFEFIWIYWNFIWIFLILLIFLFSILRIEFLFLEFWWLFLDFFWYFQYLLCKLTPYLTTHLPSAILICLVGPPLTWAWEPPNWKYLMAQYSGTDPQVRYNGPLARDGGLKSDLGSCIYNSGRTFII